MGQRRIARILVAAAGLAVALAGAEVAARWIGGYGFRPRLRTGKTVERRGGESDKWLDRNRARSYVEQSPVAPGTDRDWFLLDPPPPSRPVDAGLARRADAHPGFELSSVYEWNAAYVRRAICIDRRLDFAVFSHVDDLFVYEPPDGDIYPQFRFTRNIRYASGLQTNAFGWRGEDVQLVKPAGTVRIAFVGASTTLDPHADRYSYPEYVGRWLNEWAHARSRAVRFEAINAGREGIDIDGVAGVVRHELAPVRPDLVVDYEGGNQFWPDGFVRGALPPRPTTSERPPGLLSQYSALAQRIGAMLRPAGDGREPSKPALVVDWPADVDEQNPELSDPRLPLTLPTILAGMERMRAQLESYGASYVPLSFVWLVEPGMALDARRDAGIDRFLNVTLWPFSYAHIRRYADFQNRVFRKYASTHRLPFVDLAAVYPRDPRLFFDAVHMTPAGIKLKAWLVFQQLLPELERRLDAGALPTVDPGGRAAHPAFAMRSELVRLATIRQNCGAAFESRVH